MAFGRIAVYADDSRPGPSEINAPGHTNIDLGASWTPNRRIEIRGQLKNLLNQDYYASPDPRFVPAPGINGSVTVAIGTDVGYEYGYEAVTRNALGSQSFRDARPASYPYPCA